MIGQTIAPLTPENQKFVLENQKLAYKLASKYAKMYGVDPDDAKQLALLGVMRASQTYDPEVSRPSTYCTWWIKAYLTRELPKISSVVVEPPHIIGARCLSNKHTRKFEAENGRSPTNDEMWWLDKETANTKKYLENPVPAIYTKVAQPGGEVPDALDLLPGDDDPHENVSNREIIELVKGWINELKGQRKVVLRSLYGLDDGEVKTYQQVGDIIGISRERVRQIRNAALDDINTRFQHKTGSQAVSWAMTVFKRLSEEHNNKMPLTDLGVDGFLKLLKEKEYNQAAVAKELGVNRTSVYEYAAKKGIDVDSMKQDALGLRPVVLSKGKYGAISSKSTEELIELLKNNNYNAAAVAKDLGVTITYLYTVFNKRGANIRRLRASAGISRCRKKQTAVLSGMAKFEIIGLVSRHNYNVAKAAAELGVSCKTFYNALQKHNIDLDALRYESFNERNTLAVKNALERSADSADTKETPAQNRPAPESIHIGADVSVDTVVELIKKLSVEGELTLVVKFDAHTEAKKD